MWRCRSWEDPEASAAWQLFLSEAKACAAMRDYRARHFGARRPGPPWPLAPAGHEATAGGFSEKAARKAEQRRRDLRDFDSTDLTYGRER